MTNGRPHRILTDGDSEGEAEKGLLDCRSSSEKLWSAGLTVLDHQKIRPRDA